MSMCVLFIKKNKNRPVMDRCMYFIFIIRFKIDNKKLQIHTYIFVLYKIILIIKCIYSFNNHENKIIV